MLAGRNGDIIGVFGIQAKIQKLARNILLKEQTIYLIRQDRAPKESLDVRDLLLDLAYPLIEDSRVFDRGRFV